MKLRLKENTLRIRLSRDDVDTLIGSGEVCSETLLPNNKKFCYGVRLIDGPVRVDYVDGGLWLGVLREEIKNWNNNDRVGFNWSIPVNEEPVSLQVLLEKDFQCLTERKGEDESKLYANPNQAGHKPPH
jgi:hypothetical protein